MLLTETIVTVMVGLVLISLLIDWVVLRVRVKRLKRPGRLLDAAIAARVEKLAVQIGGSGPPRSSEEVLAEALDLLSEKYGAPRGAD